MTSSTGAYVPPLQTVLIEPGWDLFTHPIFDLIHGGFGECRTARGNVLCGCGRIYLVWLDK
jgi:hypothetical protein